ncbi:hypothetical protein [Sphingomonas jatrophae]|uniref:Uncharacterized protein n=1 Tax=Sphingomonas jatrophae TaxID=1166337 RepID=A0A1I6K280_9SPHN|nr:hypothetical protein [Sphingomonas jatrophae]SFR85198.1 hypothetical protein SAMN05192580_1232 [Sphingomonas jatrophae]
MTEATWSGTAAGGEIDWRMSASLENVPRGDEDLAEVTSLERAVLAWQALDPEHRAAAVLTAERPIQIDGAAITRFTADGIASLAEHLPAAPDAS